VSFGLLGHLPVRALAWNDAGHMTVALLAYRHITDDGVRAKLVKTLEKHPHFDLYLAADRPPGVDRDQWVIARAATWPDFVRPKKGHPRPDVDKYHHGAWHFIDAPFVPPSEKDIDTASLEPKPPHAVSVLADCVTKLKAADTSSEDRAVYLCWLLHLVGDLHQPLHASKVYSAQFPLPEGDRGGNYFFVPNSRHAPELHSYWDSLLGQDSHFSAVDLTVENVRTASRFSRQALKQELQRQKFAEWADESHKYAVDLAYRGGKLQGVNVDHSIHHSNGHAQVPHLTHDYDKSAEEAALRRGALAGHRLADQLNELFKD
jgi:hypothetical protein